MIPARWAISSLGLGGNANIHLPITAEAASAVAQPSYWLTPSVTPPSQTLSVSCWTPLSADQLGSCDCLPLQREPQQYCRDRKHAKPIWFCVVSCHILWFTFTKAIFNVLKKKITGEAANALCSCISALLKLAGRVLAVSTTCQHCPISCKVGGSEAASLAWQGLPQWAQAIPYTGHVSSWSRHAACCDTVAWP
jgi:hypothetical protein